MLKRVLERRQEEFAGDMHGCVPLQLAQSKFLQVHLTESVHKVILQQSIPAQICQFVLYYYQYEE